jgi:hypothetical protein
VRNPNMTRLKAETPPTAAFGALPPSYACAGRTGVSSFMSPVPSSDLEGNSDRSVLGVCIVSTSSTLTDFTNQRALNNSPSTSGEHSCGPAARKWTRCICYRTSRPREDQ